MVHRAATHTLQAPSSPHLATAHALLTTCLVRHVTHAATSCLHMYLTMCIADPASILPAAALAPVPPSQILQDAHQQPHTSPLGLPLALTLTGNPCLGPDGAPLALTPDGKVLLGCQGQPLLGPAGRMLVLGAQGDLRYQEGPALRGPNKQRVYLCANGALSHALGELLGG